MKGLFVNSKAKKCSIHESGKMIYECLIKSKKCEFDYVEVDSENRNIPTGYDLYFFNYHYATMSWVDCQKLKDDFGFVMTVVLEVLPNDPFPLVDKDAFDIYCAIDPSMDIDNEKVFVFPRPLEPFNTPEEKFDREIPIIGSFGLPTPGKGFERIIKAVNEEFDKAIVKINMPSADFVPNSRQLADEYEQRCRTIAKEGIEIQITHDFMEKNELIKWCFDNTINCFFYDRNQPGLSATTDQAISSERPLLVSDNETFRHIYKYIKPYPQFSIKEAIKLTIPMVKQMKNDWSQESFTLAFDNMFEKIQPLLNKTKLKKSKKTFEISGRKIKIEKERLKLKTKILKKMINSKTFKHWNEKYFDNFDGYCKDYLEKKGYKISID